MEVDSVERPSWLTREFLEETLRSRVGFEDAIVTDSSVHPAVGKGENYSGVLYRIPVKFLRQNKTKIEETRLIIKVMPAVEGTIDFLTETKAFKKETTMTSHIIPSLLHLLKEKAPNRRHQPLSAYCYQTKLSHTLILEDLTLLGCKLVDRRTQLDLAHSVVAIQGLARLHAGSVALHSRDPSCLDCFKQEILYIDKKRKEFGDLMKASWSALAATVEKWEGYEKYSGKIRALIPTVFDRTVNLIEQKPNSFLVLNHGDCWVNNMLFHYSPSTGEVDGVRFIDFPMARFNSPVLDLHFFLFSSPNSQVRSEQLDYLMEVYHKELSETLKVLDQDPEQYTLQQLKDEFEEKIFFGFVSCCTVLPVVLTDPSNTFVVKDSTDNESGFEVENTDLFYSGERYRRVFQSLLHYFEQKGVL